VQADVDEPNVLSIRVLEKLSMVETGRTIVAGRPLVNYEKARSQQAGPKHSTMSKVILLMLTGVLLT
jgi:RimJ/RimL family protein N-acetyltransferase